MTDLTLGITLKADGSGFVGSVKVGADELKKLGDTGKRAGEQASKGTDTLNASLGRVRNAVVGTVTAYASFATVQRFISAAVTEITKAEKATANLNAVLRATGGTVGFTADELSDLADQLERATLFDDAEIKQAEAVLLTFRQVQGDTFKEAIGLAADLAALMGGDLQGAVLQLGKALEDPTTGLTALRRSGISFTEQQQDLIKSLVKTGDQAKAMQIILDTVAGQIGGVAAEQVSGLTGKLNELDDAWGDFLKSLADSKAFDVAIAGLEAITRLIDRLNASGLDAINNKIADLQIERSNIFERMREQNEDAVLAGLATLTGSAEADRLRLDAIDAELAQFREAARFVQAGNALTPTPPRQPIKPIGGGGGGTSDEDQKKADKIKDVIEALRFEDEQLSRTAEQQALYNALHQAGVDVNSAAGQTIDGLVQSIQRQTDAQTLVDAAQEAANATMEEGRQITEAMRTPAEVYADVVAHLKDLLAQGAINQETFNRAVDNADKVLEKATDKTDEWADTWKNVGAVSTEALADILLHAENVTDVLEGLMQQLLQIATQKLIAKPFGDFIDGLFDSESAKGNVFDGRRLVPMAKGHVTDGPEIFPMANGGVGLRGEAGPEGVMPLQRDARGRLGVIVANRSGDGGGVEVNIYNQSGGEVKQQQRQGSDGRTILDLFIGALNSDIGRRGPLAQSLESAYGLSRRGRG